jgi:hypothetical protein
LGGWFVDGYQVVESLYEEDYFGAAGNVGGVLVGFGLTAVVGYAATSVV